MASIPGFLFVIIGIVTAGISYNSGDKMVIFFYVGISMFVYGTVKMYVMRKTIQSSFCHHCGRQRVEGSNFCSQCGTAVRV